MMIYFLNALDHWNIFKVDPHPRHKLPLLTCITKQTVQVNDNSNPLTNHLSVNKFCVVDLPLSVRATYTNNKTLLLCKHPHSTPRIFRVILPVKYAEEYSQCNSMGL